MPNLPISQLPLAVSGQPESWMAIVNYDVDPSGITNKIYFSSLTEQFSGSTGTSGTSGSSGSSGTSGTDGSSGTSGTSGTDGSSGTSGIDGSSGTSGTDGSSGSNGTDGSSGTSGVDGSSGTSGTSGSNGTDGSSGTSGIDGSSGTSGLAGTSGSSGTSGTSAAPSPFPTVYGLFSQTGNSVTVSATTTESTLIGTGVGTLSVPSNGFQIGDSFVGRLVGHISSKNNITIRIKIKTGDVILGDTGLVTLPQTTNKHYTIDLNFTVRNIGAPTVASIVSGIVFTYSKDASNAFEGSDFSVINNTTFDTTISNTLNVTVQWGSTDVENSIYSEYFVLNKVY